MFKGSSSLLNLKLSTNTTDTTHDSPDSYSHRQRNLYRPQEGRIPTGRSIYYIGGESPVHPKQRASILEPLKSNYVTKLPTISPKSVFSPERLTLKKPLVFNYENSRSSDKRLRKVKNFSEPVMPEPQRPRIKSTQDSTEKLQPIVPKIKLSPLKSLDISLMNFEVVQSSQIGRRKNQTHKKYNQDQLVVYPHFSDDYRIFGVFDGHGASGHHVAQNVATFLTDSIASKIQKNQFVLKYDLNFHSTILTEAYHETESQLSKTNINVQLSGSTSCLLLFARQQKQDAKSSKSLFDDTAERQMETVIYCANLGDSRAIIYGDEITELSIDHKPDDPVEMDRIQACGGIVEQLRDIKGVQVGPARVWLPDYSAPGLAMSRSFGDKVAHTVGVSSEPTVKKYVMKPTDRFLILGSDGIWQYMDNEKVVDVVLKAPTHEQALEDLIRAATESWQQNDFTVDDISCIIIFFNTK